MSLSESLWKENDDLARAALEHRFVRGIGDGTLPLEGFQSYVAQDAFFLESFARACALALAHSPDRDGMGNFAEPITGVLEELKLRTPSWTPTGTSRPSSLRRRASRPT